jgi:hypothetical protein
MPLREIVERAAHREVAATEPDIADAALDGSR